MGSFLAPVVLLFFPADVFSLAVPVPDRVATTGRSGGSLVHHRLLLVPRRCMCCSCEYVSLYYVTYGFRTFRVAITASGICEFKC